MRLRLIPVILLMSAVTVAGNAGAPGVPWYASYERAMDAQERKDWQASITFLNEAIRERPEPKLKAKTYGLRFVNYLPYYYIGMAYYKLDQKGAALRNFALSEKYGAVREAPLEYSLLRKMKAGMTGEKFEPLPGEIASVEALPLEPKESNNLPWYVSYETALAYEESGDWLNAVENLKHSLAAKSIPKEYARTYGLWFISYLPYYYLGVAYYNQGLWRSAVEYFETSERFGEIKHFEQEYGKLTTMLADAKTRSSARMSAPSEEQKQLVNAEITWAVKLFNEENYVEAEKKFNNVLKLDPYNSVAKNYVLRIAEKTAPPAEGSANDFMAGVHSLFRGKYDESIVLFNSAGHSMSGDADFHAYLGAAYAEKYLSSNKNDASALKNARAEFQRAKELDSDYRMDKRIFSEGVVTLFQKITGDGKK